MDTQDCLRDRIQSLAEELVQTEEREKRRLARMLHDGIGQSLSLMHMKLRRWQKSTSNTEPEFEEIRQMLEMIICDTRSLTFELCPPFLYEVSLVEAITWVIDHVEKEHRIAIDRHLPEAAVHVKKEVHILLYSAVRELLTNCMKHANAKHYHVDVGMSEDTLSLSVSDDGSGFPEETHGGRHGVGLYHMKTRFADFGISLDIASSRGEGSMVTIRVPSKLIDNAYKAGTKPGGY